MNKTILAAVALLSFSSQVLAQPALPVLKKPLWLGELARAVQENDRKVLNTDCMKLVEAFNETFKPLADERLTSCEALASYLERLNVDHCPTGTQASFTRIMRDGKVDLYGFSRGCRPGEEWAYDNQWGIWVVSLICGNFISKNELPLPRQHINVSAAAPTEPTVESPTAPPAPVSGPIMESVQAQEVPAPEPVFETGPKAKRKWYDPRGTKGKLFWAGIAGAAVLAACNIPEPRCFTTEVAQTVIIKR